MKEKLIAGAIGGAFFILALYGAFWYGSRYEGQKRDAEDALHLVQAQNKAAEQQRQLDAELYKSQTFTTIQIQKVSYVTEHYVEKPGAPVETRPPYYLTAGAVSLWNGALSGSDAATLAPSAATGSGALVLTPIDFGAALTNAIVNFGQYRDCRTIVRGWQDWYRSVNDETHH